MAFTEAHYLMALSTEERNLFHILHAAKYQRFRADAHCAASIDEIAQKAIFEGIILIGEQHGVQRHMDVERQIVSKILRQTQDVVFCLEPGMEAPTENPEQYETHRLWDCKTPLEFSSPFYLINHNIRAARKISELAEQPRRTVIGVCGNNHIRSSTHSIQYFTLMQGILPVVVTQQEELGNIKFSNLYYNIGSRKDSLQF